MFPIRLAEYEMKGIPVRLEIGPRDIENNSCVLVRRDTGEKIPASLDNIEETVEALLENIQKSLYENALKHRPCLRIRTVQRHDFSGYHDLRRSSSFRRRHFQIFPLSVRIRPALPPK